MESIKLPTFICVGAAKSGTTTLHQILLSNPKLYLPLEKDFHFFDFDENYNKGVNWYQQYYHKSQNNQLLGEVAADYLYSKKALLRIKETLGSNVKIIILLREPLERAYSEYKHKKRYLKIDEQMTFEECFKIEKKRNFIIDTDSEINFFSRGFYSIFIDKYEKEFGEKNILLLSFNDLKNNQQYLVNKITNYLEIDNMLLEQDIKENIGTNYKYKWLQRLLHEDNVIKNLARKLVFSYKIRKKIKKIIKLFNNKQEVQNKSYKDEYRNIYNNELKYLKDKGIYFENE